MFSIEMGLVILIAIYIATTIILGLIRGWSYLMGSPSEEEGKEYYFHDERIIFILAGFSLTALSLIISLFSSKLEQVSSVLLFFSLAFSALILSSAFIRLRIRRISVYISDILLNAGLLSLGCGFLVFFVDSSPRLNLIAAVFIFLVTILVLFYSLNYILFDKYARNWNGGERKNGK